MTRHSDMMGAVQANIDRSGQHIFFIGPSDDEPAFAYTIGNALSGLPELLIIGNFSPGTSGGILNDLGRRMRASGKPLASDVSLGGQFPVRVRVARPAVKWRYTIQAGQYFGHERYDVLQLLLCDRDGRYPGDPGCDPDFDVPLAYGVRS